VVFPVVSSPRLYNEDPEPAERTIERELKAGSREMGIRRDGAVIESQEHLITGS
jgi:hypothetical protein